MNASFVERLFHLLSESRKTVVELSRELNIPATRIYAWKRGSGNPKHDDFIKLREWMSRQTDTLENAIMQKPISDFIAQRRAMKLDSHSEADANSQVYIKDDCLAVYADDPQYFSPIATLPSSLFPRCNYAEKVSGNSMAPKILNQGYVIGKLIDKTKAIESGGIYGVHFNQMSAVRYVEKKAELIVLTSHNKESLPFTVHLDEVTLMFRVYHIINPS